MNTLNDQIDSMADLFSQLGLSHSSAAIDQFIREHAPLSGSVEVWNAPWWNSSQAQLLQELINFDGIGALAVDALNTRLR